MTSILINLWRLAQRPRRWLTLVTVLHAQEGVFWRRVQGSKNVRQVKVLNSLVQILCPYWSAVTADLFLSNCCYQLLTQECYNLRPWLGVCLFLSNGFPPRILKLLLGTYIFKAILSSGWMALLICIKCPSSLLLTLSLRLLYLILMQPFKLPSAHCLPGISFSVLINFFTAKTSYHELMPYNSTNLLP